MAFGFWRQAFHFPAFFSRLSCNPPKHIYMPTDFSCHIYIHAYIHTHILPCMFMTCIIRKRHTVTICREERRASQYFYLSFFFYFIIFIVFFFFLLKQRKNPIVNTRPFSVPLSALVFCFWGRFSSLSLSLSLCTLSQRASYQLSLSSAIALPPIHLFSFPLYFNFHITQLLKRI